MAIMDKRNKTLGEYLDCCSCGCKDNENEKIIILLVINHVYKYIAETAKRAEVGAL